MTNYHCRYFTEKNLQEHTIQCCGISMQITMCSFTETIMNMQKSDISKADMLDNSCNSSCDTDKSHNSSETVSKNEFAQ